MNIAAINPLSSLIFCAECGGSCYSLTSGPRGKDKPKRDYYYFQCKNYRMNACSQKKSIRMDVAEAAAIASLTQRAAQITALALTPDEYVEPAELAALRQQLRGLEALGRNPAIDAAIADLKRQIENYAHKSSVETVVDDHARKTITELFGSTEFWEKADLEESDRRTIYRDLIEKVVIKDGAVVDVKLKI